MKLKSDTMITLEEFKYICECVNKIPERFQKEFLEEAIGFENIEIDGLSFDEKSTRKNTEYYVSEIMPELTEEERELVYENFMILEVIN